MKAILFSLLALGVVSSSAFADCSRAARSFVAGLSTSDDADIGKASYEPATGDYVVTLLNNGQFSRIVKVSLDKNCRNPDVDRNEGAE